MHNTARDVRGVPRGLPPRSGARCSSSAARGSTSPRPTELGVDRIFGRGTTPGEVASLPRPRARPAGASGGRRDRGGPHERPPARADRHPPPLRAVQPRPLRREPRRRRLQPRPASATSRPRCASATDGDEGLFASYSDVQFRAPVRAGDVLEVTADASSGSAGAAARSSSRRRVVCRGRPDRGGERRRGARPAARRDDGPRHRRRPGDRVNAGGPDRTRHAVRHAGPNTSIHSFGGSARTQPR